MERAVGLASEDEITCAWLGDAAKALQKGRFVSSIFADQTDNLGLPDLSRNIVKHLNAAITLAQRISRKQKIRKICAMT